eukprot:403353649
MSERLQILLDQQKFYEYEQLTRTLFFKQLYKYILPSTKSIQCRAKMRRKTEDMKKVIARGLQELAQHNQKDLLADLLETYYMEHVKKVNEVDDFFYEQLQFAFEHGDHSRMENLIERVIEFTRNEKKEFSRLLAQRYKSEKKYSLAYSYFLKSRDTDEVIECLEEVMKHGYKNEMDLFIARIQLDFIARYEGFEDAKKVKRHFIKSQEQMTPILNFTEMLPELIQVGDFGLFKEIKEKYDQELNRDPTFIEYLDKISVKHFGQKLKQESGLAKLLGSLFGGQQ